MTDSDGFQGERDRRSKGSDGIQAQPPARFHPHSAEFQVPDISTQEPPRRWWYWLAIGLAGILSILAYDRISEILWIGVATVEFELLVVDAHTAEPVPNAKVLLVGRHDEDTPEELFTGSDGVVTVAKRCRTAGTSSLLRHSGSVYLSEWNFTIEAQGYQTGSRLWTENYHNQIQKQGGGYFLPIRVELKKTAD